MTGQQLQMELHLHRCNQAKLECKFRQRSQDPGSRSGRHAATAAQRGVASGCSSSSHTCNILQGCTSQKICKQSSSSERNGRKPSRSRTSCSSRRRSRSHRRRTRWSRSEPRSAASPQPHLIQMACHLLQLRTRNARSCCRARRLPPSLPLHHLPP